VPEDKRAEPEGEGNGEPKTAAEAVATDAGDDLEALAGALPQPHPSEAPHDGVDEADLGTLSKVAGSRLAAPGAVAAAPAVATGDARPAGPPPAARWTTPLLFGVGIGMGLAVTLFALGVGRTPQTSAPALAAAAPPAPSPALPDAPEPPVAAPAIRPSRAPSQPSGPAPAGRPIERIAVGTAPAAAAAAKAPAAAEPARASSTSATPVAAAVAPAARAEEPTPALPAETGQAADEQVDQVDKDGPVPSTLAKAAAPETVDKLLDEALSPTARRQELERKREAALAAAELPLTPSRDELTQAMTVILPAIRGCAMGQTGLATAAIVLRSDGRVAGVEVNGAPFVGAASGRCMEGVIRRAHFPRFKQPTFRIKFPLAIQ
jgi:hypothetical protein